MVSPIDRLPEGDVLLEQALQQIVRAAQRSLTLGRVILFGSRARGDARPDSDIDLAFDHRSSDAEWADFVNEMAEHAPTLVSLDLVDLARVDASLRARIERQGRMIHG
jgi:predicted nucleotidyltransferase